MTVGDNMFRTTLAAQCQRAFDLFHRASIVAANLLHLLLWIVGCFKRVNRNKREFFLDVFDVQNSNLFNVTFTDRDIGHTEDLTEADKLDGHGHLPSYNDLLS
ncbi:hypothetical protein C4D60_Mb09t17280 [Musa balbisiana]|uniref:Uncharacterized protein n=1 Tax=Musa balbisiana TaxID=52838 RepID=A0A4S8IHU1_MUSBA|nr:hypothetical protein C4D60_Mb09t17280 [Musa balbisiana]